MLSSDYMEGAHPLIMQRLLETNLEKTSGYGFDPYSLEAVPADEFIARHEISGLYALLLHYGEDLLRSVAHSVHDYRLVGLLQTRPHVR